MHAEDVFSSQSLQDLSEDFATLLWFAEMGIERIQSFQKNLLAHPASFPEETREVVLPMLRIGRERYQEVLTRLHQERTRHAPDEATVTQKLQVKREITNELRSLQLVMAGALVAGDWQSPSYAHTLTSQAGRQTGKIRGTYNDYSRDYHSYGEAYERRFIDAYIDGLARPLVRAVVTSSGMAAFSTAVVCLQKHLKPDDRILVGQGTYFQNKHILQQCFGAQLRWVDEMNTDALVNMIQKEKPRAIFLDTLCNTPEMQLPDLETMLPRLSRAITDYTYLVLDNSVRAMTFQPLKILPVFSKLQLIVIESLNKYYQFGFDRVTGGIAWAMGRLGGELFTTRMHLGTNLPDVSTVALIEPNRALLTQRLARISRNTLLLANAIQDFLDTTRNSDISQVIYPGLPSHPSYAWAKKQSFCGGYFMLQFDSTAAHVSRYESFIADLIKLAKKRHIPLIAGTSFGFDVTRVYLTALHANEYCTPFVRVSLGTETRGEIEALKKLFIDVIRR